MSWMFGCLPAVTSFGARIHMEQSFVGNVLSSCAMVPPMLVDSSRRYTLKPESARSKDACMPATPPPTTRTAPTFSSIFFPHVNGFKNFPYIKVLINVMSILLQKIHDTKKFQLQA